MGIIDDYFNGNSDTKPDVKKSSLVDDYLRASSDDRPKVRINTSAPKPPISGFSKEQSDKFNEREDVTGTGINRETLTENFGNNIVKNAKAGIYTASSGLSDVFQNKPAEGVGKIGLGLMGLVTSPLSGAADTIDYALPTNNVKGATTGERSSLLIGGVVPVSKAGQAVNAARPSNKALSTLVDTIDPAKAGDIAKAMRENPRLAPVDLSPDTLQTTQRLFAQGKGRQTDYLKNTSDARMETAKDAVESAMDQHLGAAGNAADKLEAMKEAAAKVGREQIAPAIASSKPVNLSGVLEHIDKALKPNIQSIMSNGSVPTTEVEKALAQWKEILAPKGQSVRVDATTLHDLQSHLRYEADGLLRSSVGSDRQLGNALMGLRNKIVSAIDDASEGKYKPALSKYRDEKNIDEAYHEGHDSIISNSKKMQDRPEFFAKWVNSLNDNELEAAREGARIAIDTQINGFKNAARKATDVGEVEFNRDRIKALFGEDEANSLFKKLKDERAIANSHSKIVEGSQTAMRMTNNSRVGPPEQLDMKSFVGPAIAEGLNIGGALYTGGTIPFAGATLYGTMKGGLAATNSIRNKIARERDMQFAKYALPTEGPDREALIQELEAVAARHSQPKQSILHRASNIASRVIP